MSQQDCLGHSPKQNLNKTNSATLANRKYVENFINLFLLQGASINSLLKKKWKLLVENLDVCVIFVMMRESLVMILLGKNLSMILKKGMQLLSYF